MRALVTGAGGFIGHHVVRALLRDGVEVRALLRPGEDPSNLAGLAIERREVDVRDLPALLDAARGAAWIFHLAALNAVWAPDPRLFDAINVEGTRHALEAARKHDAERFVYTSTCTLWDGRADGRPVTEEVPPARPRFCDPYSRSKQAADDLVTEAAARGLPALILHPTVPVGPGDLHGTPLGRLLRDALARRVPAYYDAELDLAPVEDVAAAHLAAARRGATGRRYILAGEAWRLGRLFRALEAHAGVRAPRVRLPFAAACLCAALDQAAARLARRAPRTTLAWVWRVRRPLRFDAARARAELGWAPGPVEPALARALAWLAGRWA
jgi:dihydroflavonol-4-reductase